MTKANLKHQLEKLLDNELSLSSNDQQKVRSGYKTLLDILRTPQAGRQLHGYHEILFECLSQIILTSSNQFFDDQQLRTLLELASNACVLSMSQNQVLDGWLQNIEERTFEKPDSYDDDDDDSYEDVSESEEEEEKPVIRSSKNRSERGRGSSRHDSKFVSATERSSPVTQPISQPRNAHVTHSRDHRGAHQNAEPHVVSGQNNRGARGNSNINDQNRRSDNGRGRGRRLPPFDNKYRVDLRLYDCYICGEYGHVQYDCLKKQGNAKQTARGNHRGSTRGDLNNRRERKRSESSSSSSIHQPSTKEIDSNQLQQVYNQSSKLLNSSQTVEERNKAFEGLLSLLDYLPKQQNEHLSAIFLEKESLFSSLFAHVALNTFLFTDDQYSKLYRYKHLLLPGQRSSQNENRVIFSRQRLLSPLKRIDEHIRSVTQIQQTIFNDFQEHIIRATAPISIVLFDLTKYLLKSNIYVDTKCFEHFIDKILFGSKKDLFSSEQLNELQTSLDVRRKRSERNSRKQIWKERIKFFRNEKISADLKQWISELEQIFRSDAMPEQSPDRPADHAMWYFVVLIMASSGHLNKELYEQLFQAASQSMLFNAEQKFHFQFYLKQGHAPITIEELNAIKVKLESQDSQEKKSAYEQLRMILDRKKPSFNSGKNEEQCSPDIHDLTQSTEDTISIIDNHVVLRLTYLVEMICSDQTTFSQAQCTELLDKFLHQSSIVRPLSTSDEQRLLTWYSRPIALNELKSFFSSSDFNVTELISLIQNRTTTNTPEVFDYLTEMIVKIFENRRQFSIEKCEQLRSSVDKKTFGKKRYQEINETYQKVRYNQPNLPSITPAMLTQLLTNILVHDHQAHLEFLTLLEDLTQSLDLKEVTIELEINRCLLSSIVLVISAADFSNASNINFYRQRLRTIVDKHQQFFSLLLTEQQHQLILSRTATVSEIDLLIDLLKTNSNEKTYLNVIHWIEKDLKDKTDLEKIINLILYSFDQELLTTEQTLRISHLIAQKEKLINKTFKNLLQFLIDLLQLNIHSSPKVLLHSIETNSNIEQTIDQISMILKAPNGKYAVADWKRTMTQLLTIFFDRHDDLQDLKDLAQRSPMLQTVTFKQQLQSFEKKESSVASKDVDTTNDQSAAHRELFRNLESDDRSANTAVVQKLRAYLLDEQLAPEILLSKFIQALQIVFQNAQKFSEISFDEWATLISNNRGKIFSNDTQCDQLLMNILLARLQMPIDTLNSLYGLIESRKAHERYDGLRKLLSLLQQTQMNNNRYHINHLPTISNYLYSAITRVIFDQKFNDNQVRQCVTAARRSWLLNAEHRQKLNDI